MTERAKNIIMEQLYKEAFIIKMKELYSFSYKHYLNNFKTYHLVDFPNNTPLDRSFVRREYYYT